MRPAMCLVLAVLVGCSNPKPTDPAPEPDPARPAPAVVPPKGKSDTSPKQVVPPEAEVPAEPVFEGPGEKIINDYHDNPIAADIKYKDKPVRVDVGIREIARKNGVAALGFTNIAQQRPPGLNGFLLFNKQHESAIASLKVGAGVTVDGICRGRTDDGISRVIRGYEFHVKITDCRVVPGKK